MRPTQLFQTASRTPGIVALWGVGVVGMLSSILMTALVHHLRSEIDERLEPLQRELEGLR